MIPTQHEKRQLHYICWTIDYKAGQEDSGDIDGEDVRTTRGLAGLISSAEGKATFCVIPSGAEFYLALLCGFRSEAFRVVHYHSQVAGYDNSPGAYTSEQQKKMYGEAIEVFSHTGGIPKTFRTGNCSAYNATFAVEPDLGSNNCSLSWPASNMTYFRSNWVDAILPETSSMHWLN